MNRSLIVFLMSLALVFSSCKDDDDDKNSSSVGGHEYVDLGLPSGLKWATMNVGATKAEECGDYFAWGEVAAKEAYTESNAFTYDMIFDALKSASIIDDKGNLVAKRDAATHNWGDKWRMPTMTEFDELVRHCTWTWQSVGSVNGYRVQSKVNDNWIFIPAVGDKLETSTFQVNTNGYYWCSSALGGDVVNNYSYSLHFGSDSRIVASSYRVAGLPVRPVLK